MTSLLRLQLRRDRRQLLVWVLAVGILVAGAGSAVVAEFPAETDRVQLLTLALATPALLALRGVPNGSSTGSLVFFQLFSWLATTVALMNTFLAARHGRGDEEHGRRELVAATPVGRTAPVLATVVLGLLADLAVAVVTTLALLLVGQDLAGSALAGLALGVTGAAFLGVGLLASQLLATSRGANAVAGAAVGLAYLLRAAGDALGTVDLTGLTLRSAWPSWLSPLGWGEQTLALTADRAWPLLLGVALFAVTTGAALVLQSRRNLGQSLLAERRGPATAGRGLRSSAGLAWRLHRPAVLGWAVGGAVLGLCTGSLASAVAGATEDNPQVARVLQSLGTGGSADATGLLVSAVLELVVVLATAAGVQGVLRLRGEEVDGHAELLLTSPLTRLRWLGGAVVLGVVSVLVVLTGLAAASWLSFAVLGDGPHARSAAGQAFGALPAALVLVGVTALLVTVVPRHCVGLAWSVFALAVVLGLFGQLLDLPGWLRDLSPFSHVPTAPADHLATLVLLLAVTSVLTAGGLLAVRRRELVA